MDKTNNKKIIFLGTPDISAFLLEGMVKAGFNIVGVITKEDKVRGRNNDIEPSPVAKKAVELGLRVHKPHRLNTDFKFIKELKPDLLLTFAYGQMISDEILGLGTCKPLNLHASLLPKYRGAAPIQYALKNGDSLTGVSLMEMVHEMDAGDVFSVINIEISPDDNFTSLSQKVAQTSLDLVIRDLPLFFEGKLNPTIQDSSLVSKCPTIKKEEEKLSLEETNTDFVNHVRSISYLPGAYLYNGNEIIKIYKAQSLNETVDHELGSLIKIGKKTLALQLAHGQVSLLELQRPGKKRMTASDFLNGVKNLEEIRLK
ncbi:MAG: methionyl-tRNA formyltransferase [Bacilli bacterium]